jgi:hypothetical protein
MKITPKPGDYFQTDGITDEQYMEAVKVFVSAGCPRGEWCISRATFLYAGWQLPESNPIGFYRSDSYLVYAGRKLSLSDLLGDEAPAPAFSPAEIGWKDPSKWSGEGIPPVGTECIVLWRGGAEEKVRMTYIGDGVGCYKSLSSGLEYTISTRDIKFRPLKSEREIAVEEMKESFLMRFNCTCSLDFLGQLYDAGYRKIKDAEK